MALRTWLRSLWANPTRQTARPQPRLGVQQLEAREVPSAVFDSVLGVGSATGYITPYDNAIDAAGNTFVTGSFGGTMDFDPLTDRADGADVLTARGTSDVYVAKYAPDNTLVWARRMGSDYVYAIGSPHQVEWGYRLSVDGVGNVYVSGSVAGVADFGPFTLANAGQQDAFAVKLDAAGTFQWVRGWGDADRELGNGITTDAAGNVYQVGFSTNTAASGGWWGSGAVVKKYSPTGAVVWAVELPSHGGTADGVATDAAGNVYVSGSFAGTVDFNPDRRKTAYASGSGVVSSGSGVNGYVLKLTGAGAFGWVAPLVAKTGEAAEARVDPIDLAVDSGGNVVVGGMYRGPIDFDPKSNVERRLPYTPGTDGTPLRDGFVIELSPAGALAWATPLLNQGVRSIALDAAGSVYTAGLTWTPYTNTSGGTSWRYATQVSKLATAGAVSWTASLGTNSYAYAIAVNSAGTISVVGTFYGVVDFDPGEADSVTTHPGGNRTGLFLVKLRQD